MSFFRIICPKNPLMETIRKTYKMTPLNIPDSETQPLMIVAHRGRESSLWGPLEDLFAGVDEVIDLDLNSATVANVSVENTGSLNMDFGFSLLSGLLKGFGVELSPFKVALENASEISLSFENVQKKSIGLTTLGKALIDKKINLENPAMHVFTRSNRKFEMYLISSVLQSNQIMINIEKTTDDSLGVEAPDLGGLTDVSVELKETQNKKQVIAFAGTEPLTFAFSAVELFFDKDGKIKFGASKILKRNIDGAVEQIAEEPTERSFLEADAPALMGWNSKGAAQD